MPFPFPIPDEDIQPAIAEVAQLKIDCQLDELLGQKIEERLSKKRLELDPTARKNVLSKLIDSVRARINPEIKRVIVSSNLSEGLGENSKYGKRQRAYTEEDEVKKLLKEIIIRLYDRKLDKPDLTKKVIGCVRTIERVSDEFMKIH